MTDMDIFARPAALRRRNRTLVVIILAVALAAATGGTLYLRHYGFHSDQASQIKFH